MPVVWCFEEIENLQQGSSSRMEEVVQAVTCKWAERERERIKDALQHHCNALNSIDAPTVWSSPPAKEASVDSLLFCIKLHSLQCSSFLASMQSGCTLTRSQGPWGFLLASYILLCCQYCQSSVLAVHWQCIH